MGGKDIGMGYLGEMANKIEKQEAGPGEVMIQSLAISCLTSLGLAEHVFQFYGSNLSRKTNFLASLVLVHH